MEDLFEPEYEVRRDLEEFVNDVIPDVEGSYSEFELDPILFQNPEEAEIEIESEMEDQFEFNSRYIPSFQKEMPARENDTTRSLKNVATDFVVKEFFSTPDSLHRFMTYVITLFEEGLAIYRQERNLRDDQVIFLYKGGNIIRFISKEFILELPASTTREIDEFYSPFFKRGDADFAIHLDATVDDYDEIFYELSLLAYLIQDKIRAWFSTHLMRYFDFFKYNSEYKKEIMLKYLNEFNHAAGYEDVFEDFALGGNYAIGGNDDFKYMNNIDRSIRFVEQGENWKKDVRRVLIGNIGKSETFMTITHNNALDFPGGEGDVRVKFNLTRTKVIFTLLRRDGVRMNVGGELIDIGIAHRDDFRTPIFSANIQNYIAQYTLTDGPCSIQFYSYNLLYISKDIEEILFSQLIFPWLDKKYKKRLNRLYYLYFIDIFIKLKNSQTRLAILRDARDLVFALIMTAKTEKDKQKIKKGINKFERTYGKSKYDMSRMMTELKELMDRVQEPDDYDEMNEMGSLLVLNSNFMIDTIKNIRNYCNSDGVVTDSAITDADIDDFV